MRSKLHIRRPSAALVVALVALFAALGGTGYAAATLSGREIQRRSIPANRVIPNALGGGQIDESKLGPVPTAQQALTAQTAQSASEAGHATNADNATNAQNAVNAQTAQNAQQLQGRGPEAFMANSVRVYFVQVTVATGGSNSLTVSCGPGEKGIGGGAAWIQVGTDTPTQLDAQLTASMPVPATGGTNSMSGWRAAGLNNTGGSRNLRVYTVCVPRTA